MYLCILSLIFSNIKEPLIYDIPELGIRFGSILESYSFHFISWLTSIFTGKITTQKFKKWDWSVKRDFSNKNIVHNTEKWQFRYLL